MKRRTGKGCTGLITAYHQTFKPLISWSICSRTSSSIICRPVRHRRGSGAAQEPDGVNSFSYTCTTQSLCIHQPVRLWSLLFSTNVTLSPVDGTLDVWDSFLVLFIYLQTENAQRSDPFTDWDQFLLPVHMFFLLCGCVFGFLLPCQHVLCIRLYVLRCIGLYFVPLSGLLITPILSLKCNYVHHVMFLVERHLVDGGWERSLGFGRASNDGKQKHALKMGGRDLRCFSL